MIIQENLLRQSQMLKDKLYESGEKVTRSIIKKTLNISESQARDIMAFLDNPNLVKPAPVKILNTVDMRGVFLYDPHIPYQDKESIEIVLDHAENKKANVIIIGGDLLDFYQISRFTRDPKKRNINSEIKEAKVFLGDLRKRFPKARIIYRTGNHDERLDKYIFSQAPDLACLLEDLLQEKLELKKHNIEYMTNFFKIGHLWILHGHEVPTRNSGGMVNICDSVFRAVYDHFICGHYHQKHTKTFKRIDKTLYCTNSVGWLGNDEAAEYSPLNKYVHGFADCEWNSKGDFQVENYSIVDGVIYR